MRNLYLGFKLSLAYFSLLPVRFGAKDKLNNHSVLNGMLLFLPWVGLILGIGVVMLYTLLSPLGWYGAVVASVAYMMLYGFLHTEAVIDVFDALFAAHGGKDPYAVMKEPTVGAIGVLYGVSFVVLKLAGLVWLLIHGMLWEFVAIVVISRLSLLSLIVLHDFRSDFLTQLKEALDVWYLMMLFVLFTLFGSWITPYFIPLLLTGVILGFLISLYLASKLRFVNGDVLGTTLEAVEILLFVLISIWTL